MPLRMTTRSAGRAPAVPRGGRTGGRAGRGCRRTREQRGRGDGKTGEPNDQGVEANKGVDGVPDFSIIITQQLQNLLPTILAQIEKMESVLDMSGCGDDQKVKYIVGSFVGKALTRWNSQINTRRLAMLRIQIGFMSWLDLRGGGSNGANDNSKGCAESGDRNVKDDNKRSRTGNAFATTANPVRREYTGTTPKCANCNLHHSPESLCRSCFNCNRLGHLAKDCRVVPRMVNLVNARNPTAAQGACFECGGTDHFKAACPRLNQAQRRGGNRPNQDVANNGGQGRGNNDNQARGRAFILGVKEARVTPR
ncbi:putative reverse transcriptase domain-containing protein [Tanacetum coccineum]